TIERVTWTDRLRLAAAWNEASIAMDRPERATLSPRDVLARILAEPMEGRRRAWAEALERGAGRVADAARILAGRRAEADGLLRAGTEDSDLASLAAPTTPEDALGRLALKATDVLAPIDPRPGDWDEVVALALGSQVLEGWPARLTPRWIGDLFRGTGL